MSEVNEQINSEIRKAFQQVISSSPSQETPSRIVSTTLVATTDDDPLHSQQSFLDLDRRLKEGATKLSPAKILAELREEELQDDWGADKEPDYNPYLLSDEEYLEQQGGLREHPIKTSNIQKDPAKTTELMGKKTELIKELGPQNTYDTIAGIAQLKAREYQDFELLRMGTQLSHLIQTIPYDHDHFYKVIAVSKNIERRLQLLEELKGFEEENVNVNGYNFSITKVRGLVYRLGANLWNTRLVDDPHRVGSRVMDDIVHLLMNNLDYEKSERSQDHYAGASDQIETYYDDKGREVYYSRDHRHGADGQGGLGYHEKLTIYDDPRKATELWKKVKKLIEERTKMYSKEELISEI